MDNEVLGSFLKTAVSSNEKGIDKAATIMNFIASETKKIENFLC